jgi:hypothetical protein
MRTLILLKLKERTPPAATRFHPTEAMPAPATFTPVPTHRRQAANPNPLLNTQPTTHLPLQTMRSGNSLAKVISRNGVRNASRAFAHQRIKAHLPLSTIGLSSSIIGCNITPPYPRYGSIWNRFLSTDLISSSDNINVRESKDSYSIAWNKRYEGTNFLS